MNTNMNEQNEQNKNMTTGFRRPSLADMSPPERAEYERKSKAMAEEFRHGLIQSNKEEAERIAKWKCEPKKAG